MQRKQRTCIIPVFQRIAIFIDGWNFKYATYDAFGIQVDYKKLLDFFSKDAILIRAYYYTGEWDDTSIEHYLKLTSPSDPEAKRAELLHHREEQQKFWRFLSRNGYRVVKKPIKIVKNVQGDVQLKADLDLEIAIDMLSLADKCDKEILVSGDGDFTPLVYAVGEKGVRVAVVSTQHPDAYKKANYRASDDLLDAADEFIPIENIKDFIKREDKKEII